MDKKTSDKKTLDVKFIFNNCRVCGKQPEIIEKGLITIVQCKQMDFFAISHVNTFAGRDCLKVWEEWNNNN